ncbi:hypothetical protein NQ315_010029 [Exocentrus adspersus]|uniref:Major facilitator superfamily (MFS) profile domain-containing protein n=1 Tax=Exocentrus adspersus TaxID=1586481 RepID=A0AAV8VK63_9CUCU|nr:hypothetical protein NQ315_010029 [Exocentrus adspersus]
MNTSAPPTTLDCDTEKSSGTDGIKVFKYRWVVLFIFCLSTITNFMQFLQFTIIANIVTNYLIEKYSLKVTLMVATGLTSVGNLVKIACANPDGYYTVMIGQTFCALGQIYLLSIPSKFASVWFGPKEVSTACALAVLGTQTGAALGSVLSPFLVKSDSNSNISSNLYKMMIFNAILSCVVFLIVAAFFKAKPELPPSLSQRRLLENGAKPPPFLENCRRLLKNKNFLLLLLSFGLFNSMWNSFGILINTIYTHYFPNGESDVGIITLLAIISGGCIGSVVFGWLLDKTHQFKKTSMGVMLTSAALYVLVVACLMMKSRIALYIIIPTFGFFAASALIISFEYTLEETYPIPESVSCSVMNATIFLFAIINSLIAEGVIATIGYLYVYIIALIIFLGCAVILFFVKTNLNRRDANLSEDVKNSWVST